MDKSTPTHRPELFSVAQPGDGSRRILASLESSGKANTPSARLARLRPGQLVVLLTLLAVVAAGIASFSYLGLAPARHNEALAPVASMAPLVTAPEEVERRAAAIVNEPLPAIAPVRHRRATTAATATKAGTVTTAAPSAAPPAAYAAASSAASSTASGTAAGAHGMPPKAMVAVAPASAHPAAHTERGMQARQRHQARHAAASGAARSSAAVPQPDSDVALLAALVAHSGSQPSAILHTRDVVERGDGDSTDSLLRRCQRLGGAEAGLCRARICSGQWLHEAACRTPVSD